MGDHIFATPLFSYTFRLCLEHQPASLANLESQTAIPVRYFHPPVHPRSFPSALTPSLMSAKMTSHAAWKPAKQALSSMSYYVARGVI